MAGSALDSFSDATRAWFGSAFPEPTPAQDGAWSAIASGSSALVVAPTGSGKTLAAFLWSLDKLVSTPRPAEPSKRCRVLYISPLKALAVDVERNLLGSGCPSRTSRSGSVRATPRPRNGPRSVGSARTF
jgi:ATP-dependent helicase Lhr and Lhr-like helicase